MKLLKLFFALSATIATVAALHSDHYSENSNMQRQLSLCEIQEAVTSLRGVGRVLAQQNTIANSTCNKLPRICRLKRIPGPDCCNEKCVDVNTYRFNCGMWGTSASTLNHAAKESVWTHDHLIKLRHCGGCNKKCKKGKFCVYGMCSYAWLLHKLYHFQFNLMNNHCNPHAQTSVTGLLSFRLARI
jgi:hypothetical protein